MTGAHVIGAAYHAAKKKEKRMSEENDKAPVAAYRPISGETPIDENQVDIFINSQPTKLSKLGNPYISYDEIHDIVYPEGGPKNATCTWSCNETGRSGEITDGEDVELARGLKITMTDTSNT